MRRTVLLYITVFMVQFAFAQMDTTLLITSGYFQSPVDHQIKLAGSFGELRANHFHAGIDIKSQKGLEGDTVRASAPGYVSRIKIQRGSYGKALYVDHPNGYTTVYAHLQRFDPEIEAYILSRQKAAQSYELDVYLPADSLSLLRGQPLGQLGNTGRSYGPHLHFEIRHTATEMPQNPYLHGLGPSDSKSPMLYAVAVQGFDKQLSPIVKQSQYIQPASASRYGPEHHFKIPAWRAGMLIQSFDQMDGSSNSNGLYHLKMYVDDSLHFEMKLDSVNWDETKYINSFIEYEEKRSNNRTLIRCYKQKANPLSIYGTLVNNGFFKLYKDIPRRIRFEAVDFFGNVSTYECLVSRSEDVVTSPSDSYSAVVKYDSADTLHLGSLSFFVPKGTTDNTLRLYFEENIEGLSKTFALGRKDLPIFKNITVQTSIAHIPLGLRSRTVLVYNNTSPPTSYGGTVSGDTLTSRIDKLGNFQITIDTIPPSIESLEYSKNARTRANFKFRVADNYNCRGSAHDITYHTYIDGEWVVSELKALGDILTIPLDGIPSGAHYLRIVATDHSGNTASWTGQFEN